MSRPSIALMAAAALAGVEASVLSSQDPDTYARRRADADRNKRHAETSIAAAEAKRARRAAGRISHKGPTP